MSEAKFNLIYKFHIEDKESAIELIPNDLVTLNEKVYLNDNIMNFYLRFIGQELVPEDIKDKTYFFTTYFYSLLEKKYSYLGNDEQSVFKSLKNYDSVRKVYINFKYESKFTLTI